MTKQEQRKLCIELMSLSVFREILKTETIGALLEFLNAKSIEEKALAYGKFVYSLADDNYSFTNFLRRAVYSDENKYIISVAQKVAVSDALKNNAEKELSIFTRLSQVTVSDLWECEDYEGYKPEFQNEKTDFIEGYNKRLSNIQRHGYGIFATSKKENRYLIIPKPSWKVSPPQMYSCLEMRERVNPPPLRQAPIITLMKVFALLKSEKTSFSVFLI